MKRQRLLDLFDRHDCSEGPHYDLVIGPAGSGKTTLLAEWIDRGGPGTPTAWLTAEPADNNVEVFRTALATALLNTDDPAVIAAVAKVPGSTSDEYHNVGIRLAEVMESGEGVCLIIDDAHVLHDSASLSVLRDLVRWAPTGFRLVIAARFDPPMVLHRARLDYSFNEIGERELAFAADEAVTLFRQHGLDVTSTELRAVMHWTEGWAAGLQLAAVTAVHSESARGRLADFDGTGKAIADYLVGEFLTVLDEATRHVLVTTSIPAAVDHDLAVRLSGNRDAARLLDQLADGSFLLDRSESEGLVTYRYHPLMRSHLRAEARRLDEQIIQRVERETARWCLEVGQPFDALRHAVDSADPDLVIETVERCAPEVVMDVVLTAVIPIIDRAPAPAIDHPTVRLLRAAAELRMGNVPLVAAALTIADRPDGPSQSVVADVLRETLRVQLALCDGPVAASELRTAIDHLEGTAERSARSDVKACALLHAAIAEIIVGRLPAAERFILGALGHAQVSRSSVIHLQCLGAQTVLCIAQGRLSAGVVVAERTMKLADERGIGDAVTPQIATMMADHVSHLRVESPITGRKLWTSLESTAIPAVSELARVLGGLQSVPAKGGITAESASNLTPHHPPDQDPLAPAAHAMVAAEIQYSLLTAGHHSQAKHYAGYVRSRLPGYSEGAVLTAMVDYKLGRMDAARGALRPALGELPAAHPLTTIWAWMLQAVLTDAGNPGAAFDAAERAIAAAEPERMIRPFWLVGSPIRSVLVHNRGRFGRHETFAEELRTRIDCAPATSSVNLSPRELDVLRELPSWRPAEVIASDLFISVNTAKTHLRGIYRKLGVTNRRDAVTAAQERRLI